MLVDWLTVIAQAVNFLILVYLLHRFLYGPITHAIEQRRLMMERQASDAKAAVAAAQEREQRFVELEAQLVSSRDAKLAEAQAAANRWAAEIKATARTEVDELQRRWQDALAREQESFWQEFETRLGGEVYSTAERVVADLAGKELDQLIQAAFLERLSDLSSEEQAKLQSLAAAATADSAASSPAAPQIQVLSARPLDAVYRDQIVEAIRRLVGSGVKVSFAQRESLMAGIELRGPGWKSGWSIRGYLDAMRGRLGEFVGSRLAAAAEATPATTTDAISSPGGAEAMEASCW